MEAQTLELADRLEKANEEMIGQVDRCTDEQWHLVCQSEGWSVGVVAHHVAFFYPVLASLATAIAGREPVEPTTPAAIDARNAELAQQFACCTRQETLELLRRNGAEAVLLTRGLEDEDLSRTVVFVQGAAPMSALWVAEYQSGHVHEHLASIRKTIGTSGS